MAAGNVQVYDSAYKTLFSATGAQGGLREWDNQTASSIFWYLASGSYTPADTHTTVADLTLVTGTPGSTPVAATTLAINAGTGGDIGKSFFDSADVTWGNTTTISNAKYLVAAMPQTAGTAAGTDELLFYVALDTATTVSSVAGEFSIAAPTTGWFYVLQS